MKYALVVLSSPAAQSSYSAYQFARAALEANHQIVRVFFYQDGVYNGNLLASPPQDETDMTSLWADLFENHGLDLCVCIAAGVRRGVLDQREAERYGKESGNLASCFTIGGLGQLTDASIQVDRLVTFG